MNIHQLRCAVTVARLGSQTRAAEELYMSQPNLSKALNDLEQTCGFRIFTRTGTGMAPTRRGEEFLEHARAVLEKLDLMDAIYQGQDRRSASLNVAVCGAGYLTRALCAFLDETNPSEGLEINMREGRVEEVVRAVLDREAEIGVIRYAVDRQNRVLAALAEQGLHYLLHWTFRHVAVMSRRHPLAGEERLEKARLAPYAEVTLAAELPPVQAELQTPQQPRRRARIWDQATRLELVSRSRTAYLWSPPMPKELLERYGLTQLPVEDMPEYQDALIYPRGYHMSRWEQAFYDLARREAQRACQE